ncbi:MAG: rhamnan synthesis F family protein [Cyanobacteriota bacterium]|nr:rhamnan synthesis F family protein [Cyanobacteriota bacterium]
MRGSSLLVSLRQALESADGEKACELLQVLRREGYPSALLRPVLASCHPGLDPCYLDLALLSPALLLASRIPALLGEVPLDPLRLQQTHGCDLATFLACDLQAVLRGIRPLYAGLPAIEIRHYHQLVQLNRRRLPWLRRHSALECLALEAEAGLEAEVSALSRWAPSRLDRLLTRPWVWLELPCHQGDATLFAQVLGIRAVGRLGSTEARAAQLADQAARLTLQGGGWFILWTGEEPPPAAWRPLLQGLLHDCHYPLAQLGMDAQGVTEFLPARPSASPSLLAIAASWLAKRQPRQILGLVRHWLHGPPASIKPRIDPVLLPRRVEPRRPLQPSGILVLAATQAQLGAQGLAVLQQRAQVQAVRGGFSQALVWPLQDQPLASIAAGVGPDAVLAFIGAADELAPGAWPQLAAVLAWRPDLLLCSDEELLWCNEPRRIGQRQFAASPTPFRLLSRGHLPGLVALCAKGVASLDLQPSYGSLHAVLRDLGLQWLEQGGGIEALPQALLRREPYTNPTLLPISTAAQRQLFTPDQLLEIEQLTLRQASAWLVPAGRLQSGPRQGSVLLRYAPGPSERVSVIIPFRDQAQLTRQCVLTLLEQAGPTPLELVLVDNGSTQPAAIGLAAELAPQAAARGIRLIGMRDDSPFNFAALNNRARRHCSGSFLLFLNNDIRFESPRPVEALLDPFALASTGAVSARLLFEDGTIQHHGLAAAPRQPHDILSPGKGLRPGVATEPFAVLELPEQWSAATAACLLMRAADFDRLGGFDESFVVAYNDVDLCWRLTAEGRAVIVTPEPRIIHAESKSRGDDIAGEKRNRLAQESGALRRRYPLRFQVGDPLYHRFLGPASQRFEPMGLPALPLAPSRERLLYSWVRPQWPQSGTRPLLIYVHWDGEGDIRADVFEQLRAYQSHVDLVFVSAAPTLLERSRLMAQLRELCAVVLVRHNEGYDFGSWQAGLNFCRRWMDHVPLLILTNDSCYGPLHSVDDLFRRLAASQADVVGLTESTAIRSHLQSYFLAYKPRVIRTALFWAFWAQIGIWGDKINLVCAYEVGWSGMLADAGFRLEALYLAGQHGNVTHTHWRQLLEELHFPFLKTELLRLNPIRQDIDAWYAVANKADARMASMIRAHLCGDRGGVSC